MKLRTLEYSEFEGSPRAWTLSGLELGDINLVVGQNATGKSRTLRLIQNIALTMAGLLQPLHGRWSLHLEDQKPRTTYDYVYHYPDRGSLQETLAVNGDPRVERDPDGTGKIWSEEAQGFVRFQVLAGRSALGAKRDGIQHPFLEPVLNWAGGVRAFLFGSDLGRTNYLTGVGGGALPALPNNPLEFGNHTAAFFMHAMERRGFKRALVQDMISLGYPVEDVTLTPTSGLNVGGVVFRIPSGLLQLTLKEEGVGVPIGQQEMSQGMYRALAILIHIHSARVLNQPSCLLIDDIGEGLDFERSTRLIKILIQAARKSRIQLVMATNDRFVMNAVPLKYWSIITRKGGSCAVLNYKNHRQMFKEFEYTGLNNFDLLSTGFWREYEG